VPATRKRCTKHAPSPKSECGHLNGGKLKAVTYTFSPGYRENAEEEEEADISLLVVSAHCVLVLLSKHHAYLVFVAFLLHHDMPRLFVTLYLSLTFLLLS
jgi:hypothetical protein